MKVLGRELDTRHPTVALIADQHTKIEELRFENGLLAAEVDRLRARLHEPPSPISRGGIRCGSCGVAFVQNGPGRPRLYCYTCRPIKRARPI